MTWYSRNGLQLLAADPTFQGEVRFEEPMSRHTTYRIGGPAYCWAQADSMDALVRLMKVCAEEGFPYTAVGKGSNLLVSDEGYRGVVVCLGGSFKQWNFDQASMIMTAGAAAPLSRIVQEAFRHGVSGMEFAVGTPGTVGGALRMNAGTDHEWLGAAVVSVTTYKPNVGLVMHKGREVRWEYRRSSLPRDEIVVECELSVKPGNGEIIRAKMDEALARRKRTQPLDLPSCGSVFRNPEGRSAAQLIEAVGLKGAVAGGAQISEKHANFIVNVGDATAVDVLTLIREAQVRVDREYGIELQPEVRFLGF